MNPLLPVDLALGCLAVEAVAWVRVARRSESARAAAAAFAPGLAAGAGLLMALRLAASAGEGGDAAAGGLPLWWVALGFGGLAHALDLWRRWPRSRSVSRTGPRPETGPAP